MMDLIVSGERMLGGHLCLTRRAILNSSALVVSEDSNDQKSLLGMGKGSWSVESVCPPQEVLGRLENHRYDLLLLDARSDAAVETEFIDEMRRTAPESIPVVFDRDEANEFRVRTRVSRAGIADYVQCQESFQDQVSRECLVVRLAEDECTRRIQPLITRTPTQRGIYHRVVEEVNSPHGSLERVADFIANDPMLTAKVLQMVNSAALGMRRRFVDAHEAVIMLGGERIKSMIVFVEVFSICEKFRFVRFSPDKLWRHSLAVGRLARELMRSRSRSIEAADASFTGGLLHDVGKLMLAINLPEQYREVLEDVEEDSNEDIWASEVKFLQTSHAEVGAMILESWNLPYPILEAVGYHHAPNRLSKEGFSPLDAVAVANVLLHEPSNPSQSSEENRTPVGARIWRRFGDEQMIAWHKEFVSAD